MGPPAVVSGWTGPSEGKGSEDLGAAVTVTAKPQHALRRAQVPRALRCRACQRSAGSAALTAGPGEDC